MPPVTDEWVAGCDEELTRLSVLTHGEIQKGISRLSDRKRKATLQKWLDTDVRLRFQERILPVTEDVAKTWGALQGEAERKGVAINSIDGLIGATAFAHNLTVVTRNEMDLMRTGAKVINPWS